MTTAEVTTIVCAAVQALGMWVLIVVTWVYVRHTGTLAEQAKHQHDKQARSAVEFILQELKQARETITQQDGLGQYGAASTLAWEQFCGTAAGRRLRRYEHSYAL